MSQHRGLLFRLAALSALLATWTHAVPAQKPAAEGADKDYAAELPRIPPKSPAEALKAFRRPPRLSHRAGRRRAAAALARWPSTSTRTAGSTSPSSPSTTSTPARSPTAAAASGCWRTPTATASTTRARSSSTNLDSPTAVCLLGRRRLRRRRARTSSTARTPTATARPTSAGSSSPASPATTPARRMLNSFRWGLDNRIHISTSLSGGDVRHAEREGRQAGLACAARASCSTRAREAFELTSGGGQHGMSMDDWGRTFVCANSDPVHLVMYDGRYLARNPYLAGPGGRGQHRAGRLVHQGLSHQPQRAVARRCGRGCGPTGVDARHPTRAASRPASSPAPPASPSTAATPGRRSTAATCSSARSPTISSTAPGWSRTASA